MMFEAMEDAFDASGYDQLEVYAEEEETVSSSVSDGAVDTVESETARGLGIRALVDNKVGFAYTDDPENVLDAANKAIRLARLSQFRTISFPVDASYHDIEGTFDDETASLREDEIVERTREATQNEDVTFSDGRVSRVHGRTYLMNSSGIEASFRGSFFVSYFNATREGRSKRWFDAARSYFPPSDVAGKAVELLELTKDPISIDEGERDIVLSPYAQYQIFSGLLYPAFNADRVQRGKSPLKGRIGDIIAAESLSCYDDGRREAGIGSSPFDREGTPTQRTSLIEEGELASFLYDIQRAEKKGVESTGNASGGYSSMPHIGPTNFIVEGEDGDRSEIDDGTVYIQDVAGVHTANTTSGDFSLNITTGFVFEDGQRRPIKGGMFVGNIFDVLGAHLFSYGETRTVDSLTSRPAVFGDQTIVT